MELEGGGLSFDYVSIFCMLIAKYLFRGLKMVEAISFRQSKSTYRPFTEIKVIKLLQTFSRFVHRKTLESTHICFMVDKNGWHESLHFLLKIGQHPRELNPYWRKGGSGLPSQNTTDEGKNTHTFFTRTFEIFFAICNFISSYSIISVLNSAGNRKWFKRAYERAKQQAEDEGRSLTDVAAERWGVYYIHDLL